MTNFTNTPATTQTAQLDSKLEETRICAGFWQSALDFSNGDAEKAAQLLGITTKSVAHLQAS